MKRRDKHQWSKARRTEQFFVKAKSEGYKARSAYKLIEILERYVGIKKQITANCKVIDLGAAPGAWLQVVSKYTKNIDAVDLLNLEFMPPYINFIKGDIFSSDVYSKLSKDYGLILSDMAPNCTGSKKDDHLLSIELANRVLELSTEILRPKGNCCIKIFDGLETRDIISLARKLFTKCSFFKPKSSFQDSPEFYLICENLSENLSENLKKSSDNKAETSISEDGVENMIV